MRLVSKSVSPITRPTTQNINNPIEHRLVPHITKACQGVIFDRIETVKSLIEKTKTKEGLKVTVQVIDTEYQTGRKATENFKENMSILFDEYLPQWNYKVVPLQPQNRNVIWCTILSKDLEELLTKELKELKSKQVI
jgi:Rhodopirellula transposase.